MTPDWPVQDGTFALGDLEVERGGTIRGARLVWQTHGTLNAARRQRRRLPVQLRRDAATTWPG